MLKTFTPMIVIAALTVPANVDVWQLIDTSPDGAVTLVKNESIETINGLAWSYTKIDYSKVQPQPAIVGQRFKHAFDCTQMRMKIVTHTDINAGGNYRAVISSTVNDVQFQPVPTSGWTKKLRDYVCQKAKDLPPL